MSASSLRVASPPDPPPAPPAEETPRPPARRPPAAAPVGGRLPRAAARAQAGAPQIAVLPNERRIRPSSAPAGSGAGGLARPLSSWANSLAALQKLLAIAVAVCAASALAGWVLDIGILKTVLPGLTTMKVNTAIALLALAIAQGAPRWSPLAARSHPAGETLHLACALAALAITGATLAEYAFHLNLAIDEFFIADPGTTSPPYPGRPSPATAAALAALSAASILLRLKPRPCVVAAHWLAAAAAATGALSLIGYAYGVEHLYSFGPFVSVALNTACALCALAAGLLLTRNEESFGIALQNRPGARAILARLLPASFLLPFATGLLVLSGIREGLYAPMFGISIFAVLTIAAFLALSWETAAVAARIEGALERSNSGLQAARLRAEEATRAKSKFLAGMSHELRTPLHALLGYAELLSTEGRLSAAQHGRVTAMLATGRHLLETINGVLAMSEIEAGRVELKPAPTDLRQLAAECITLVRPNAEAKGLPITLETAPGLPDAVMADPTRLRQILVNLLGNAVKFTERGSIAVRIAATGPGKPGGAIRIAVADTGRGVPAARRSELFQDFQRLGADRNGPVEGAGLGLSIAARLAGLMGGEIGYADNPQGGSIFTLTLPALPRPANAPAAPQKAREPAAGCTEAAPRRVLIVDDMAMNREIASAFLRSAGHAVTEARSGEAGVKAAAARDFDVVLMDVRMDAMDGFEATRRIRALGGSRGRVPIVAMTAHAFAEQIEACRRAGMDGHLPKPFNRATILAAVDDAVASRRMPAPQPAADTARPPVIDLASLDHSAAFLPADDFSRHLARVITDGEALLATLGALDAGADVPGDLADRVHNLAGRAGMLGLLRLSGSASRFEHAARSGEPLHTHLLATDLKDTLAELRTKFLS